MNLGRGAVLVMDDEAVTCLVGSRQLWQQVHSILHRQPTDLARQRHDPLVVHLQSTP